MILYKVRKYQDGGLLPQPPKNPLLAGSNVIEEAKAISPIQDFNEITNFVAQKTNSNPQKIYKLLQSVAYHESKLENIPQKGGGPAQGLYQFEPDSLETAINRAKQLYQKLGKSTPAWLNDAARHKNATYLHPAQQHILALSDYYIGTAPLKDTLAKPLNADTLAYFWEKGHKRVKDPEGVQRFKDEYDPLKPVDPALFFITSKFKG